MFKQSDNDIFNINIRTFCCLLKYKHAAEHVASVAALIQHVALLINLFFFAYHCGAKDLHPIGPMVVYRFAGTQKSESAQCSITTQKIYVPFGSLSAATNYNP